MAEIYTANSEDTDKDKVEFYASHSEAERKVGKPPAVDYARLISVWDMLLNSQNGPNYDDYTVHENSNVIRYVKFWSPPPADLLIMGTGSGREVVQARSVGYNATGTTLGKENLPFAKWKFGLDLHYGENCSLPYPDESFDIVAAFQVFEHCHAPYLFLIECNRLLRQGGTLMLEWPPYIGTKDGSLEYKDQIQDYMGKYEDDNLHHACCWTPAQARIMTRRCNFEDVEVFISGVDGVETERCPNGYRKVTEEHPAYFSNIAPGQNLLRAVKRPDDRKPRYMDDIKKRSSAGLAHLARASDFQSEGSEFDPRNPHQKSPGKGPSVPFLGRKSR